MEFEFFSNVLSEEDTVEVEVELHNDTLDAEGERCGICTNIVIDRGVLDCCQHWFCFVCIDSWATITNLCPLCQNEIQLITCVPVFDTVDSGKISADSDSRDDGWCVEEKNNTLSFPSYYIDENAVTCLDGDGCKIRSGSVPYEETLTLGTSIACDSCDIWYHAFCVGFDPEGACVDSWFCPRCLTNEIHKKADLKAMCSTGTNADPRHLVDSSFGKMSICVADTRETAWVVSRIDGEDVANEPIVNCLSNRKFTDNHHTVKSEPDDSESRLSLDLEQSLVSNFFEDGKANNLSGRTEFLHDASSLNENLEDLKADIVPRLGEKRKRQESSFQTMTRMSIMKVSEVLMTLRKGAS